MNDENVDSKNCRQSPNNVVQPKGQNYKLLVQVLYCKTSHMIRTILTKMWLLEVEVHTIHV